jgi:site-specific DNA-methyltransferase (adenine-specific)
MAYGTVETTLANFDENIKDEVFKEVTGITLDQFRPLRDTYEFFDGVVFNESIQEFLHKKELLADYFDESQTEDIFDYIPPQKTNQIFTPKKVVKLMIDKLEEENPDIFTDKDKTFADLYVKSGLYLTEIVTRLYAGLAEQIPDEKQRIKHILENQIFGFAPSEIIYNIAKNYVYGDFADIDSSHLVCNDLTDTAKSGGDFGMKFDVVVGNPPYQISAEGGTRDIPIYNHFVEMGKKMEPHYLTMITPSRWMASGLGLSEFRKTMLEDRRIRVLVDYERMDEVFPGVDFEGGVCYFLWDKDYDGDCSVISVSGGETIGPDKRDLSEHDVFVRDNRALAILRKVQSMNEESITEILSVDKEFGWTSNFEGFHDKQEADDVAIYYNRKGKRLTGWINRKDVTKSPELIDTWKVMVPQAYGERGARPAKVLGPSFIAESPSVCTQTYLFFFIGTKDEAESLNSYLQTRFFRFLISLRKITQHAPRSTYTWVPRQEFNQVWTDGKLYAKYDITVDEIAFIEEKVTAME